MSKKRSKVKKYWKKQKFGMFFLKVFVPFMLAVSVLGAIVTEMLVSTYNTSVDNAKENLNNVVNKAEQEAAKDFRNAADGKSENDVDYEFQTAENAFAGTMEYYCSMARLAVVGDLRKTACWQCITGMPMAVHQRLHHRETMYLWE